MKTKDNKKTIIFDMDGTLYKFKGDSFKNSGVYDVIIKNTLNYICKKLNKTKSEAQDILNSILKKYGNSISIGLEKEFGINRLDYFNYVWDIDAKKYIKVNSAMRPLLFKLKNNFKLFLLSDAPMIWVKKVLKQLDLDDIFGSNIFSGEGDIRKEFGNAFKGITMSLNIKPKRCIVVGDQEETDIIPAKKLGIRTIYIGNNHSDIADYSIKNILELSNVIKKYEQE